MTDQREKVTVDKTEGAVTGSQQSSAPSISRRALVRGASVAVPTILTLNSNAAFGWAITSGTIGTRAANPGSESDAVCVIGQETKQGVYVVNQSDLVEMPGSYDYKDGSDVAMNAEQACEASGQISYSTDGQNWNTATAPGGAVASLAATQASSFSTVQTTLFPEI